MTHYSNGKAREYRVRDALIADGWTLIAQTGGSKGAADLVMACPERGWLLVQVGSKTKALGPADRERLCDLADIGGALAVLAIVIPRQGITYYEVTRDVPSKWARWAA
jgi:hypothetical protein